MIWGKCANVFRGSCRIWIQGRLEVAVVYFLSRILWLTLYQAIAHCRSFVRFSRILLCASLLYGIASSARSAERRRVKGTTVIVRITWIILYASRLLCIYFPFSMWRLRSLHLREKFDVRFLFLSNTLGLSLSQLVLVIYWGKFNTTNAAGAYDEFFFTYSYMFEMPFDILQSVFVKLFESFFAGTMVHASIAELRSRAVFTVFLAKFHVFRNNRKVQQVFFAS